MPGLSRIKTHSLIFLTCNNILYLDRARNIRAVAGLHRQSDTSTSQTMAVNRIIMVSVTRLINDIILQTPVSLTNVCINSKII